MHVSIADTNGNVSPLFASPTDGSDLGPAVPNPFYYDPGGWITRNALLPLGVAYLFRFGF